MREIQFYDGLAAEDLDHDAKLALVFHDLFDSAVKPVERTVGDLHRFTYYVRSQSFFVLSCQVIHATKDPVQFRFSDRHRFLLISFAIGFLRKETGDEGNVLDQVFDFARKIGFNENVAGEENPFRTYPFSVFNLEIFLGG